VSGAGVTNASLAVTELGLRTRAEQGKRVQPGRRPTQTEGRGDPARQPHRQRPGCGDGGAGNAPWATG
jgi:hypothetical protein